MGSRFNASSLTPIIVPPVILALVVLLASLLPNEVRIGLAIWTLASFPIGVLVGHFVLNED